MSGKQAKRIRANVYEDYSLRERSYEQKPMTGTIRCTGLRRVYQEKKQIFTRVVRRKSDKLVLMLTDAKKVAA